MSDILARVEGAIAAGIRQAVSDESTAISYHEHRAAPDLDWVHGEAAHIAQYITTSEAWLELTELVSELAGAKATIAHQCEAMSWIAGHDRQGLDHLTEAMEACQERDAAEAELRRLRGEHA